MSWCSLFVVLAALLAGDVNAATDRPVIGVLTLPESDLANETQSYMSRAYPKWLEAAGARVVPIPFNAPASQLLSLLSHLNGALFTGGDLSLDVNTTYFATGRLIYDYALQLNAAGADVFPLWGTCQGFQFINLLAAQPKRKEDVLRCTYDSENLPLPLEFADGADQSRLFAGAAVTVNPFSPSSSSSSSFSPSYDTIYSYIATHPATMNLHQCAVTPTDFASHPGLANDFTILSTNQDRKNVTFISSMEHNKYPIFAVQWHPERVSYEWDQVELVDKSASGEFSNGFFATVLVEYARQSSHSFDTSANEEAVVVNRYVSRYTEVVKDVSNQETYYWNSTTITPKTSMIKKQKSWVRLIDDGLTVSHNRLSKPREHQRRRHRQA